MSESARTCWTCQGSHGLDEPCRRSQSGVTHAAAGGAAGSRLFATAFGAGQQGKPRTLATYDSKCPDCGEDIAEGDSIIKSGDDWIHADCEDDE